jgi:hypothetical protein
MERIKPALRKALACEGGMNTVEYNTLRELQAVLDARD